METLRRLPPRLRRRAWDLILLTMGLVAAGGSQADAQGDSAGEYQALPLRHKTAAEIEGLLSTMLPQLGEDVHVVADERSNQVLLRGSPRAQQLARDLLSSLDKPVTPAASPPTGGEAAVLHIYPVSDPQAAVLRLRSVFPDEQAVRMAAEPTSGRLIVLAPPSVQQRVAGVLDAPAATQSAGAPAPMRTVGSAAPTEARQAEPAGEIAVRLVHTQIPQLEISLRQILGDRLQPALVPDQRRVTVYRLQSPAGDWVDLLLDGQDNLATVRGRSDVSRQLARLVQALDGPGRSRDRATRIVPFRLADPLKVKQALDAYRGQPTPGTGRSPAAIPTPAATGQMGPGQQSRVRQESGIALVSYIFQAEMPADVPAAPANAEPLTDSEQDARRGEQLRALGMDVEVETLPDLDIVILRGRQQDVEELARIIEELERLSAEAEPEIEVYPLRHVRGTALSDIIEEVLEDLVGGRQGRISVYPLEKPNALLLIGWGEALATIKKLIRKLDQPVSPDTQLRVFVLENATAEQVQETIEQFYQDRGGLGPQVTVVADPRSDSLIVQASPRDMAEVELLIQRLDTPQDDVNLARIFKINNALADDVAETLQAAIEAVREGSIDDRSAILEFLSVEGDREKLLRSGLLTGIQVTPNVRNNTLLVTAPAETMDLLAALIKQLDTTVAVAQIKVFRVVNGDANSLITMLRSLFPADTGSVQGPNLAGAEGETSLVPLRFSVDTRSNSIIATGSEGDLKIVEALLLRLDEKGLNQRQNQVYRLKNAPANTVATAINDFLRSERIVQQAAPGIESPFQQIEREVVVVPEMISNSLILSATPRFFQEIEDLVQQLDEEPPQVMIQVLLAEIRLDNLDEFGVEVGLQDSVLFDRSLLGDLITTTRTDSLSTPAGVVTSTNQVIQAASNTPGFNFNGTPLPPLPNSGSETARSGSAIVAPQGVTNFALGRLNNELGFGGLVLSASSESVSVLIRALQDARRLDILSRPQIRTLDNQPAFIQIGEQVPRVAQSNVTTGGTIQNSVELLDVGLILGVTPRISPDGMVVMEIDAEKSELEPEQEGITISISDSGQAVKAPIIRTTRAQATVSAADGETIVLGGLITKSSLSVEKKVPYLADIPLLGLLFRYDSMLLERKELLIILTPYVIRGPDDSERIKQLETARMSWVCEDVHAIHGVTGLCDITNCPACAASIPAVYPDFDPQGLRINERPAEAEPNGTELEQVPLQPAAPNPEPPPVLENSPGPQLPPQSPNRAPIPPQPANP